jgi:hypothetical protein
VSAVGRGNACENRVAAYLIERGWLVGKRRHLKGGGDLLAIKPGYLPRLYECKASPPSKPWDHFRPEEREALRKTALEFCCEAFLALAPGKQVSVVPQKDWPR